MTKKSKSVLGGSPCTVTSMMSTGPAGVILTVAVAFGRHVLAPAETTILKVTESFESSEAALSGAAASKSPRTAGAASRRMLNTIFNLLFWFVESLLRSLHYRE